MGKKKIIVNGIIFNFDLGCKLLKKKHGNTPFKGLEDFWDEIQPITMNDIFSLENVEQRQVALSVFGLEEIAQKFGTLVDSQTIAKQTTWVNENGELETVNFNDTYELYEIKAKEWAGQNGVSFHFIKFKDTSTDRQYMLWVDKNAIHKTNNLNWGDEINAIQAIAWTFQTTIEEGGIVEIVRQGDCILYRPKEGAVIDGTVRHLTENEYRELITLES